MTGTGLSGPVPASSNNAGPHRDSHVGSEQRLLLSLYLYRLDLT